MTAYSPRLVSYSSRPFTPIDTLPVELLSYIFILSNTPAHDPTPADPLFDADVAKTPTRLSSVCKHWRRVAWETPALWTHLCATIGSIHEFVVRPTRQRLPLFDTSHFSAYLKLSRNRPLDILIDARDPEYDFGEPECVAIVLLSRAQLIDVIQTRSRLWIRPSIQRCAYARCDNDSPPPQSALANPFHHDRYLDSHACGVAVDNPPRCSPTRSPLPHAMQRLHQSCPTLRTCPPSSTSFLLEHFHAPPPDPARDPCHMGNARRITTAARDP